MTLELEVFHIFIRTWVILGMEKDQWDMKAELD